MLRVLQRRSSIYDHKTQDKLTSTSLPAPLHPHPYFSLSHLPHSVHILIFFLEYNGTLASESLDSMSLLPGIHPPPSSRALVPPSLERFSIIPFSLYPSLTHHWKSQPLYNLTPSPDFFSVICLTNWPICQFFFLFTIKCKTPQ